MTTAVNQLRNLVRNVADFPKPGIVFRDITTLIRDPQALQNTVRLMAEPFRDKGIGMVAGIESRGFIFGAAIAMELDAGFIPIRKPGKLPADTSSESYELE